MPEQHFATIITMVIGIIVTFTVGFENWVRRKHQPGITDLAVVMFSVNLWLVLFVVELFVPLVGQKMFVVFLENTTLTISAIYFLRFTLNYFGNWPILSGQMQNLLWLLTTVTVLLQVTNPIHNLFWIDYRVDPTDSTLLYINHGMGYYILVSIEHILLLFSASLLLDVAFKSKNSQRQRVLAGGMVIAVMLITVANVLYIVMPMVAINNSLLVFGYTLSTVIISFLVFSDINWQLSEEIKTTVLAKTQLERYSQQTANRLAELSNNLIGVFDLIIVDTEDLSYSGKLKGSLLKVREIMNADAVFFFSPDEDGMIFLEYHTCDNEEQADLFRELPTFIDPANENVVAVPDISAEVSLPAQFGQAGFRSGKFRWLVTRQRVVGFLCVLWRHPVEPTEEDISLFNGMSLGIGLILENTRLSQLIAENTRRTERRRMARDLHDSVTQSLHSLTLTSESAQIQLARKPEALPATLDFMAETARQSLKEMRLMLYELRLTKPGEEDLASLVRKRFESVENRSGIETELLVDVDFRLPEETEREMYSLVMEALNNSIKHARAKSLVVRLLQSQDGTHTIEVSDNGIGFDLATIAENRMGLINMKERCEKIGAELQIYSAPGNGTTIRVNLL